jgi:hypothetical protein
MMDVVRQVMKQVTQELSNARGEGRTVQELCDRLSAGESLVRRCLAVGVAGGQYYEDTPRYRGGRGAMPRVYKLMAAQPPRVRTAQSRG